MVALGIDCNSPSKPVISKEDWVTAASGLEHSLSGHVRCGRKGELGEIKHTLLHAHLSCSRAPRAPQNWGGGSGLGNHHDSHHQVAKGPRYTDIDGFAGVRGNDVLVDDEI